MIDKFNIIYEASLLGASDYFFIMNDFMSCKYFPYFKSMLEEELAKVKSKDPLLKDVEFDFHMNEDPDKNGVYRAMMVSAANPRIINVNMQPLSNWIYQHNCIVNKDILDDAYANYYIYDQKGYHLVQHECAHVIDHKANKGRKGFGMHDRVFKKIQAHLEAIEPHLDQL